MHRVAGNYKANIHVIGGHDGKDKNIEAGKKKTLYISISRKKYPSGIKVK